VFHVYPASCKHGRLGLFLHCSAESRQVATCPDLDAHTRLQTDARIDIRIEHGALHGAVRFILINRATDVIALVTRCV
jgi:hypothetical protein